MCTPFGLRRIRSAGAEYLLHVRGTAVSLFGEGRIGEDDYKAAFGGLRVYFGQRDKTLIRRHREDDANFWEPDTVFGVASDLGKTTGTCPVVEVPAFVPKDGTAQDFRPLGPCEIPPI